MSALEGVGAELRAAATSREAVLAAAVGEEILSRIELLPPADLDQLPDSLRQGGIVIGGDSLTWRATVRSRADAPALVELEVVTRSAAGERRLVSVRSKEP